MLLRAILGLQRRPLLVGAFGVALELVVISLIGSDDAIATIRGVGGESVVALAVVGAVFAGPWVGMGMALGGWCVFFPLVAGAHAPSVVALPLWLGVAALVGQLSRRLLLAERERAAAEHEARAAHDLRSPVATIHGLVATLRLRTDRDPTDEKVLAAIEDETGRLLEAPFFRRRD
jgi:signal transduction histidine kinase